MISIKHIGILFSSLILFLFSCKKLNQDGFEEEKIVIQGILIEGEEVQEINIFSLTTENNVADAQVKITNNGVDYKFGYNSEQEVYQSPLDLEIFPNEVYKLEVESGKHRFTSETTIPGAMVWESINQTVITVDTANGSQPAFAAIWNSEIENSYVVTLRNVEENPALIPHDVATLSFDEQFQLPLQSSFINFNDLFLTHYGVNRFTVYSISDEYKEVYFYQPQVQQSNPSAGVDNIEGAEGYFVGVSSLSVDVLVN